MKIKNSRIQHLAVVAAIIGTQFYVSPARAQEISKEDVQALIKRVNELEQQVKVLQRNREVDTEKADAAAVQARTNAPQISIGQNGFSFKSADGDFALKLKGVLQFDSRTFINDHGIVGNDGFLLRRLRPVVEGTVYHDFDFCFIPDFGGATPQIFDAWLNYTYRPELQLRFGKFKTPVGLEQLQADVNLVFNERSLVTDLVPNRDLGVEFHGLALDGRLNYSAAILNGVGDARNSANADFEDDKDFAGRLFAQPFKDAGLAAVRGLGVGVAGSYGSTFTATGLPATTGGTLPGFTTDGQQQFFAYNPAVGAVVANGAHWRLSPQTSYYWGPFGLLGEYIVSDQRVANGAATRTLENKAWEVSGSWVLTGEENSFTGIVPNHAFDPGGGHWGAWQLAARYERLDVDKQAFPLFANPATSASGAAAWSFGLNWWLSKNVRVLTSFSHTTFAGGGAATAATTAPGIVTRQPENAIFTRVQLAF